MSPGKCCCVCGSTAKSPGKISFHRFPKHEELSNQWARNIGQQEILEVTVEVRNTMYYVSSHHFESKMFPHQLVGARLKRTAVPTIFDKDAPPRKGTKAEFVAIPSTSKGRVPEPLSDLDLMKQEAAVPEQLPQKEGPEEVPHYENEMIIGDTQDEENIVLEMGSMTQGEDHEEHSYSKKRKRHITEMQQNSESAKVGVQTSPPARTSVDVQTSSRLSATTPTKVKLKRKLKSLQRKLHQQEQKSSTSVCRRLTSPDAGIISPQQFFHFVDAKFEKSVGDFIKNQYQLSQSKLKGGRYSIGLKQFALTVYFLGGPRMYKFLRKTFQLAAKFTYNSALAFPTRLK